MEFPSKATYKALSNEQRAALDLKVQEFVTAFRAKHPNGKTVKLPIKHIGQVFEGKDKNNAPVDKCAVVLRDGTVRQFTIGQLNRIATNAGCMDVDDLRDAIDAGLDASYLVCVQTAHCAGEQANDAGVIYEAPGYRNESEEVVLGDDAREYLRDIKVQVAVAKRMAKAAPAKRTVAKAAKATTIPAEVEEVEAVEDDAP